MYILVLIIDMIPPTHRTRGVDFLYGKLDPVGAFSGFCLPPGSYLYFVCIELSTIHNKQAKLVDSTLSYILSRSVFCSILCDFF